MIPLFSSVLPKRMVGEWRMIALKPQSENTQNVYDCSKQPRDVASSVVPNKSTSPSESTKDIEAWLSQMKHR